MRPSVKEEIDRAPESPGVYLFKGEDGKVLYVGKAVRLRARLRSYLHPARDERPSVALLVPQIRAVEWLLTGTEKEAVLLENSLIKAHRPRYNISLRDDKSYVSLRLTPHRFPRLFITRNLVRDGSEYFGPYSSVADLRQTLKLIQKLFQVRDCSDSFLASRTRPCLRYEIKRCSAPCTNGVGVEAYAEQVNQARCFLKGKKEELVERLRAEMRRAAETLEYESAARVRDRIASIRGTLEPQRVESRGERREADAIGLYGDADATLVKVLKIRDGRLVSADEFLAEEPVSSNEEITRAFLSRYYLSDPPGHEVPLQILIASGFEDPAPFEALLSERRGKRVRIVIPRRGSSRKLLDLAERNAASAFGERKRRSERNQRVLEDLASLVGLPQAPKRIEGYDISSFHGAEPVGSMVVFIEGEPDRNLYRRYNIRGVKGSNDFAMLKEMFGRRFRKLSSANRPDLILVDGGRGQLRQAVDAMAETGADGISLVSIAKEKELFSRSGKKFAPERLFLPGRKNPEIFPPSSPLLHLLQRVRDEAHRFAVERHRKSRNRGALRSVLSRIPGVGPNRQKALLSALGSVEEVARAPEEVLRKIPGIPAAIAREVRLFFHARPERSEE